MFTTKTMFIAKCDTCPAKIEDYEFDGLMDTIKYRNWVLNGKFCKCSICISEDDKNKKS